MSKKYGLISDFCLVRRDMSRTVIGYELTPEEDGEHATWQETVIYRKKIAQPTLDQVRDAVKADIDSQTDERILNGFQWQDDEGDTIRVWLSAENQRNFSEAQRLADKKGAENYTPKKFKIGEVDGAARYRTFATLDELNAFYEAVCDYIETCLGMGWIRKDTIDWQPYEEALANPVVDDLPAPEPAGDASGSDPNVMSPADVTGGSDPSVSRDNTCRLGAVDRCRHRILAGTARSQHQPEGIGERRAGGAGA